MGRPRKVSPDVFVSFSSRDPYSETVARNLGAIIEAKRQTRNAVQEQVRELAGGKRTSALTDFLDEACGTNTVTVKNLGYYAKVLDVPITAFFVPPDKRDDLVEILRILGSDEPLRDQAMQLVHEMSRAAPPPGAEGGEERDAGKVSNPSE